MTSFSQVYFRFELCEHCLTFRWFLLRMVPRKIYVHYAMANQKMFDFHKTFQFKVVISLSLNS